MDSNQKENFYTFIEKAKQSTTNNKRFQISNNIPTRLANAIEEIMGVDVSDYKNEIYEQIVRHIEKRHGKTGIADHSINDLGKWNKITDILNSFDNVKLANNSRQFKNRDGTKAKTIEIIKDYSKEKGHLIEAVPLNRNRCLEVISMYFNIKEEDTKQVPDEISPGHTSKTQPSNNVSSN